MDKLYDFQLPPQIPERTVALERLVELLWRAVQDLQESLVVEQKVVPPRTVEGSIRVADGVGWNPGAGAGLYEYRSGTWNKL
jgi:hypothetical protein